MENCPTLNKVKINKKKIKSCLKKAYSIGEEH